MGMDKAFSLCFPSLSLKSAAYNDKWRKLTILAAKSPHLGGDPIIDVKGTYVPLSKHSGGQGDALAVRENV